MKSITIQTKINAPIEEVWEYWTSPEYITKWNHASDDWHCPSATNDLQVGGKFVATMAAKDGSASFDFGGVYSSVEKFKQIAYTMDDGRKVSVIFTQQDDGAVHVAETFDLESENSEELQRNGWQAILDNFKSYVESN